MAQSFLSSVFGPAKQLMTRLLGDDNFREEVTYKRYRDEAFDAEEGMSVVVYDEFVLYAARMKHTRDSMRVASSEVEIGDVLFMFGGDFPSGFSTKDIIEQSDGDELGIKAIDPIFDVATLVTVVGGK